MSLEPFEMTCSTCFATLLIPNRSGCILAHKWIEHIWTAIAGANKWMNLKYRLTIGDGIRIHQCPNFSTLHGKLCNPSVFFNDDFLNGELVCPRSKSDSTMTLTQGIGRYEI